MFHGDACRLAVVVHSLDGVDLTGERLDDLRHRHLRGQQRCEHPVFALQDGDAFFLCTDGYWEWLQDHEMEQSLINTQSSSEWLGKMNALAQQNIGVLSVNRDNFSAFAIRIHDVIE